MFSVRPISAEDFEDLKSLAKILGQAGNLPQDPKKLKSRIELACASFESPNSDRSQNVYSFVLVDHDRNKVIGTSSIYAKRGTAKAPYTFLRVFYKEHEDSSTGLSFRHQLLSFEFNTDGPSMIGGLVLDPHYRKHPGGLGRLLSYSRFMYMAQYPERFENGVIAELLPPFNEDGSNELWEAFGARFTGLSYAEADQLSRTNKKFITNLFPKHPIYTCLFSEKTRSVIGQAGQSSKAAQRLLEKIGFKDLQMVDPFDGGPYMGASLKDISFFKTRRRVRLDRGVVKAPERGLLAFFEGQNFRCLSLKGQSTSEGQLVLDAQNPLDMEPKAQGSETVWSPLPS